MFLPEYRNCSLEFLKDILAGKKRYFMLHEVVIVRVPICPELTVEKILQRVQPYKEIMQYLPDPPEKGKYYVERHFLFTIINTLDRRFFKEALAEIGEHRAHKREEEDKGCVEIDSHLFELIEQCQSRMSGQRLAASKRTMNALRSQHVRQETPKRPAVLEF